MSCILECGITIPGCSERRKFQWRSGRSRSEDGRLETTLQPLSTDLLEGRSEDRNETANRKARVSGGRFSGYILRVRRRRHSQSRLEARYWFAAGQCGN